MTKGQKTIATSLAVIAALLALNLAANLPGQRAQAQPGLHMPMGAVGVAASPSFVYRVWRNGEVEFNRSFDNGETWLGWESIPE